MCVCVCVCVCVCDVCVTHPTANGHRGSLIWMTPHLPLQSLTVLLFVILSTRRRVLCLCLPLLIGRPTSYRPSESHLCSGYIHYEGEYIYTCTCRCTCTWAHASHRPVHRVLMFIFNIHVYTCTCICST